MPVVLIVDDSAVARSAVKELLVVEAGLDWVIEYAENGVQALDILSRIKFDVVVTDLQMPEMDGLALVTSMRRQFPDVPAILLTGEGSESIAMEALERGAASYVSKQDMRHRLVGTIEQVVATSHARVKNKRLFATIAKIEVEFNLRTDVTLMRPLVNHVEQILGDIEFCDHSERVHIGVALEETLINAMFHGNLELSVAEALEARWHLDEQKRYEVADAKLKKAPYNKRCVRVAMAISSKEARFVVRDDGPGFTPKSLPQRGDSDSIEKASGRGLVLIHNFVDEVKFNERGNQVSLMKRAKS